MLALLADLSSEEWALPTACPGWSVKDIVQHLYGVDVYQLSGGRDAYDAWLKGSAIATPREGDFEALVTFINQLNQQWVEATRRISPQLLCQLLRFSGEAVVTYFDGLDLTAIGMAVSWASPEPALVGLHVAREYTERWVHQQQIRDAVGRPGLKEPEFLGPVLATFVHGLRRAFHPVVSADGTSVRLTITGAAGGSWRMERWPDDGWVLTKDLDQPADATFTLDQEPAWRLFTRAVSREEARDQARIEGEQQLAERVFETVSIIA